MGIAFSPPDKVVHADINASSSECLRNGLHLAVQQAGWEINRAVTNGYVYLLTSPQDSALVCKVKIQDTGRTIWPFRPIIDVTFMTVDENPANSSETYGLVWGNDSAYGQPVRRVRAHITPCQIFTYVPGIVHNGNAVMGGVPYIDPNALASTIDRCADEDSGEKTWRAVWSARDGGQGSFREGWVCGAFTVVHNDQVIHDDVGWYTPQRLRMLPVNRPNGFWGGFGNANYNTPFMMRWIVTEEPLLFDAFIAWNEVISPMKIRGQIWDAFCRAKYVPWESPYVLEDIPFFSYSNGTLAGYPPHWYQGGDILTLYLRDPGITKFECEDTPPPEPTESNYVY